MNNVLQGLNPEEVLKSRKEHGSNQLYIRPKRHLWAILAEVVTEPIFLLLVLACGLYFAIGDRTEAWLMVGSVLFVILIEIIQEFRSERALEALREFAQPKARVIRGGSREEIPVMDIVVGDLLIFEEGERIAADGLLIQQNDLSVDEAVLTGESLPVIKSAIDLSVSDTLYPEEARVYQGTVVASGMGIVRVLAVGNQTAFGKLGKSIESIESETTPLQRQIDRFIKQMLLFGLIAFAVVFAINYRNEGSLLSALLFSLAFALALVPEELPVAFTTFMALGAYRMTRQKILVKYPKTVESLGSATVICLDKTGTITENRMQLAEVYDTVDQNRALTFAMWASEPEPFDAMEKAIHQAYQVQVTEDERNDWDLIYEYPLGGVPPMMTHVYGKPDGTTKVAGKGAVERMIRVCRLSSEVEARILERTYEMAQKGFRVLGVASAETSQGNYPAEQDGFNWQFEGLVALYDPPKQHISKVMAAFYEAGIKVKMITGDYPATALNIARESGIQIEGKPVTGEAVVQMTETELRVAVAQNTVFARMFPDAKLRIVEALKANGEIVAMTGDGVNDGPALKAAPIGIAMGERGTEVAKAAASMVLLDDDLSHMIKAIKTGRRIYHNLRKAFRYVISIHLPIVLTVLLPLVFGWPYLHMLMPVHVIFLELVMDPTCAVAFEGEPAEPNVLKQAPRPSNSSLFSGPELMLSLLQGLFITAGVLLMYHYAIGTGANENITRTYVFLTLTTSNILLTLANRSFERTIFRTIFYKNQLLWVILGIATALTVTILTVEPLRNLFRLGPISPAAIGICLLTAFVSVGWFEVWKGIKQKLF